MGKKDEKIMADLTNEIRELLNNYDPAIVSKVLTKEIMRRELEGTEALVQVHVQVGEKRNKIITRIFNVSLKFLAISKRKARLFEKINCINLNENPVRSELFNHNKAGFSEEIIDKHCPIYKAKKAPL